MSDDDNIEDLLSQLQDVAPMSNPSEEEQFSLNKEDMEQFVIDNAGKLISRSIQAVDEIKQYVLSAPESEQIDALATLIRSSASAIDTLNKIVLQDKKASSSKQLKELDFEQKKALQSVQHNELSRALKMSREEMISHLLEDAIVIDADVSDTENTSTEE
jgi:hypothetical protein